MDPERRGQSVVPLGEMPGQGGRVAGFEEECRAESERIGAVELEVEWLGSQRQSGRTRHLMARRFQGEDVTSKQAGNEES